MSFPHIKLNSKFALGLMLAGFVTACSDKDEAYVDLPVEELYTMAQERLTARSYTKAAKAFAEVERQHPYSNWALKAQIMSAYSYYEAKKYDEAIDGFQLFIQLHPGHADVAYAHYMVGLCFYEQIPILERDQQPAEKAMNAFNEVLNRFPTAIYAKDARFKIDLIKDHTAAKEMDVGRFYLTNGSYVAAINRFKSVIETYQTTAQVEEALYRLVECYIAVGVKDQAIATTAVLGHNYPNGQWYSSAYTLLNPVVSADSTVGTLPKPTA